MSQVNLLAHNGVIGAKPVEPFAGATFDQPTITLETVSRDVALEFEGRRFTFAFPEKVEGADVLNYREQRFGEPSDWAKAKEAERAARG